MRNARVLVLLALSSVGCTLLQPLDDYSGGPARDSGTANDTNMPVDSNVAETDQPDSTMTSETGDDATTDSTSSETAGDSTLGDSVAMDALTDGDAATDGAADIMLGEAGCTFDGVLAKYDFAGKTGAETSVAAASTAPTLVASDLTRTALIPNMGSGAFNSSGWPIMLDKTGYVSFKLTPAAGCKLSLTKLTTAFQASTTGPKNAVFGTSLDSFAMTTMPVTPGPTSSAAVTVDIAITANGGPGEVIEVRVYGYGGTSTAGTMRISGQLTVTGSSN